MTPDAVAVQVLSGRHGLVSFAYTQQMELVASVCQSFILDNGAFSAWKGQKAIRDWWPYYCFVDAWQRHPGFDWALMPDVIDGSEADNDALVEEWPFGAAIGVPVWHYHESLERLSKLAESFPRVALGSSGEFARPGSRQWWERTAEIMEAICHKGVPQVKLHGLRMLNPKIFSQMPLSSADSSNIARNVGLDSRWSRGAYPPISKAARGQVLAERIESQQSAAKWVDMITDSV